MNTEVVDIFGVNASLSKEVKHSEDTEDLACGL